MGYLFLFQLFSYDLTCKKRNQKKITHYYFFPPILAKRNLYSDLLWTSSDMVHSLWYKNKHE